MHLRMTRPPMTVRPRWRLGAPPRPGREPPCGSTGTNPATIHRPSDAGGHRWFKHPLIGAVIPPRDAPERDEATEATPAEASPEDDSPADAARRRHAADAAARGDGDASSSGTARRINFENIKSPIECFKEFFTDDIVQRICNCTNDRAKRFKVLLQLAETDLAAHPQVQEALKPAALDSSETELAPESRALVDRHDTARVPAVGRYPGVRGIVDLPGTKIPSDGCDVGPGRG